MNTEKFVNCLFVRMLQLSSEDKPKCYSNIMKIPIEIIDNILVDVRIDYFVDKTINLIIDTPRAYHIDEEITECLILYLFKDTTFLNKDELFSPETLKIVIDKLFIDLNSLKFDKVQNRLCKDNECGMFDFLMDLNNLKIGEECCVCHDKTTNKVICKHTICTPCLVQLKPTEDNDINCPLCRKNIGN
jgi:hypothetical protein